MRLVAVNRSPTPVVEHVRAHSPVEISEPSLGGGAPQLRPTALGRVTGAADPGGLEIPHCQQQFQVILLAPHQDGTKQRRRCNHSI